MSVGGRVSIDIAEEDDDAADDVEEKMTCAYVNLAKIVMWEDQWEERGVSDSTRSEAKRRR
jgi:hypothetical protein